MARNAQDKAVATAKFFALRDSGYTGAIDHNGDPVPDVDAWIEQYRPPTEGDNR
jgi:hypothetical protein